MPSGYVHVRLVVSFGPSMLSDTLTPGSSTAFERTMRSRSGSEIFGESKYFLLGQIRSDVPVSFAGTPLTFFSFCVTTPSSNTMRCSAPSRLMSTSSLSASAFVTDTPTPCSPPENLYAASAALFENLAPACSSVKTSCTVGIFSTGCMPTGMPRPLSVTVTEPSRCSVTSIWLACSPKASSAALSIASWMMCVGSLVRVYMPGRRCTGSIPRSFCTELSSYFFTAIGSWLVPCIVKRLEALQKISLSLVDSAPQNKLLPVVFRKIALPCRIFSASARADAGSLCFIRLCRVTGKATNGAMQTAFRNRGIFRKRDERMTIPTIKGTS